MFAFSENLNFRMWYPAVIQLTNDSFGTGPQNYVIFQLRDFFLSRCNPLSMLSFVKLHGALLIFLIIIIIIWYVVVFFPTTYCDRFAQKMCPNKNKQIFHSAGPSLNKFLKVSQFRKQIVKLWILPKNEQMNSFLLLSDMFSFVFWKKLKTQKKLSKLSDL